MTKLRSFYFALIGILATLPLLYNFRRLYYHCVNFGDFGFYQQGMYEIGAGISYNPYITTRNLNILSDHFDPIIWLGAGWVKLFGYTSYNLAMLEWLFYIFTFVFVFIALKPKRVLSNRVLLSFTFLVFSRGILSGLTFPIHPTTWSILPLTVLIYFICRKSKLGVALSLITLQFFKEIFPIMGLGLAFFYLISRQIKFFFITLSISVGQLLFFFLVRPIFFKDPVPYNGGFISRLIDDHLFYVFNQLISFDYPWKQVLPYLILYFITVGVNHRSFRSFFKSSELAVFCYMTPVVGLHILSGLVYHQHYVVLVVPFIALFIFGGALEKVASNKKLIAIAVIPVLWTSLSSHTKIIKGLLPWKTKYGHCTINESKASDSKALYSVIGSIPKEEPILVTGGIVVPLLEPSRKIYPILRSVQKLETYRYIALEKNGNGDIYPLSQNEVLAIEARCRKDATKIHLDNPNYLVMEGVFTDECVGLWMFPPLKAYQVPKYLKFHDRYEKKYKSMRP